MLRPRLTPCISIRVWDAYYAPFLKVITLTYLHQKITSIENNMLRCTYTVSAYNIYRTGCVHRARATVKYTCTRKCVHYGRYSPCVVYTKLDTR